MDDKLNKYSYFWTDDRDQYVLIRFTSILNGAVGYMIYHLESRTTPVFEDGELQIRITEKMLEAGVPVTDKIPD